MMIADGELALVAGTQTVALARIPASAIVMLSPRTLLGVMGVLSTQINAGVSFTVTSTNVLDLSVIRWSVFV